MSITEEQKRKLIATYEGNAETLQEVEQFYADNGYVPCDSPEETFEAGYHSAMTYVFYVLGIEV